MKQILLICALLFLCNNSYAQTFVEDTSHNLIGVGTGTLEWGDYDNDNDMDVIITGYSDSGTIAKIFKNDSNGVFAEQTGISLPKIRYSCVKWGDYDNDGDIDVLLTGQTPSCQYLSRIYKNNGDNTFTQPSSINLTGICRSSVAWGDYNYDGNLDVLMTGENGGGTMYKNNGNETFAVNINLPGGGDGSVAWGDYNNDGYLDFMLSVGSCANLYKNNGDGTFTKQINVIFDVVVASAVAWGDYNNDGYIDILLTGLGFQAEAKIYKNNGDGTFTEQPSIALPGVYHSSVAWADYNNDGYLDILLMGVTEYSGNLARVYTNQGNSTFTFQSNIPLVGLYYGSASWVDYDNDGDLDISINGYDDLDNHILKIYKNTTSSINQPPSTPTGLHSQQVGSKYLFTWNKSTDDNTPSQTLTYNIRVGSTDTTQDLGSSQSDLLTGYHKILSFGAIQDTFAFFEIPDSFSQMNQFIYWSVQSIDNGFKASTFSTYDSISPDFNIFVCNDTIITLGDSARLKALLNLNAPATYLWSPSALLDDPNVYNPKAFPKYTTTFYVTVTCGNMVRTDSVKVYVNPFKLLQGTSFTGVHNGATAWGDYDNDGDLDILLTGAQLTGAPYSQVTKIYKNNGNNTFSFQSGISIVNVHLSSVAWGDYDNDGDLDIIICGVNNPAGLVTKIYKNNGNNTFTALSGLSFPGIRNGTIKWGDYDNDGDLDLLLTGSLDTGNGFTKVYKNVGNNMFTEQTGIILPALYNSSCDWGDYDQDGDLDIILAGTQNYGNVVAVTKIYKNIGNNSFVEQTNISLAGLYDKTTVEWRDYDDDGDLDIYLTGYSNYYFKAKIYKNMGNNIFPLQTNITVPTNFNTTSAFGDYDNDGDLDLTFEGFNGSWYNPVTKAYNNNNNLFSEDKDILIAQFGSGTLNWGDCDNDGDLDILMTGFNGSASATRVYQNMSELRALNARPSVPLNLMGSCMDSSCNFIWSRSIDDKTNANSITYNFSLGTNVNPNLIVSSHSQGDGTRAISEMGNMRLDTFAVVNHFFSFDTLYVAKVQAIDNSFYPSQFSTPLTFSMAPVGHIIFSGDSISCGDSVLLGISVSNGDPTHLKYTWSPSLGLSNDTIINPIAKPTQTTWYKVTGISQWGYSFTDSIKIKVTMNDYNPDFLVTQTEYITQPYIVQFINNTPNMNYYDFVWDFGDSTFMNSNNQSINHTYNYNGQYSVKLKATLKDSYCSDSITKTDYISCSSGISDQSSSKLTFNLFPNPNTGEFTIILEGVTPDNYNIQISSIIGEVLYFETFHSFRNSIRKDFLLNSILKGVYFIKIFSDDVVITKRFIVK